MDEKIRLLSEYIRESERIVFFGGAGISTESGIPDFRSAKGLYSEKYKGLSPEEIVSHGFFVDNTKLFYDYYREHLVFPDAQPNDAHKALAELEKAGKLSAVVTQNIDSLHQKAGSERVYELHGSVMRNYCTRCRKKFGLEIVMKTDGIPYCPECDGIIKPDVVLYGESLDSRTVNGALKAISEADLLIVAGTSLAVYPAAGFINYYNGNKLVVINLSETPADSSADLVIHDKAGKVLREATDASKR